MGTECKKLNPFDSAPAVITVDNQKELVLSDYNRTEGTHVQLSCNEPYHLIGQKSVTCKAGGNWDFSTAPYCSVDAVDDTSMTEETKVLVGVLVGVAAVVILVLLCVVCSVRASSKAVKADKRNKKNYTNSSLTSSSRVNKGYYLDDMAYIPPWSLRTSHVNDGRNYDSAPPSSSQQPYVSQNPNYELAYASSSHHVDDRNPNYLQRSTSLDHIYRNSRQPEPREERARSMTGSLRVTGDLYYIYRGDPNRFSQEISKGHDKKQNPTTSKKFYGEWPARNSIKELEEFNGRALFHSRDPFLWRPVDANWGFHLNKS